MNQEEFIKKLAGAMEITVKETTEFVHKFCTLIETEVGQGGSVKFVNFGLFKPAIRRARVGRNPRTNTPVTIPERVLPAFIPGKRFKNILQKENTHE